MIRSAAVMALFLLSGCAHRAHVTGLDSNPSARVDTATFTRIGEDVVVDVQVGLEGSEGRQLLVRTQIPCRVGPVAPPEGFRIVYVTVNPATVSPMTVSEGFITVHQCEGDLFVFSGGWDVSGTISTALELPFRPPNPPIPITHVELTHVTATHTPAR